MRDRTEAPGDPQFSPASHSLFPCNPSKNKGRGGGSSAGAVCAGGALRQQPRSPPPPLQLPRLQEGWSRALRFGSRGRNATLEHRANVGYVAGFVPSPVPLPWSPREPRP